jgi:5'-deoxynucleotidase YfbR-like HD superfamily hydrolase
MALMSVVLCSPPLLSAEEASGKSKQQSSPAAAVAADAQRCVAMALVHDLAEALCGDITPTDVSGVSKQQKHKLEVQGMCRVRRESAESVYGLM